MIKHIINKYRFDKNTDRIGPDLPFTHWKLYFKPLMVRFCKKKFLQFGENSEFRPGAYAIECSKISIGNRVIIRPSTMLFADPGINGAKITIEDDVLIGSGVHFYVGNHKYINPLIPIIDQGHFSSKPILLKKGCWVGANAIILPGVTIGENAVVGAGSVVTKSIGPRVICGGIPAKIIKEIL